MKKFAYIIENNKAVLLGSSDVLSEEIKENPEIKTIEVEDFDESEKTVILKLDSRGNVTYEIVDLPFDEYVVITEVKNYILGHYPLIKQQSDQADREYYATLLKSKGVKNIEAIVVKKVEDIYSGKSLEEALADIPEENKEAFEQLIKAGVRVSFVQFNKKAAKEAIAKKSMKINFVPMPEL